MTKGDIVPKGGQILIYQSEGGQTKIEVRLEGETLWLNQAALAKLYQTTKQNISLHIKNIYDEGELDEDSVVKEYLTTAADGKKYKTKHYNLDMIISVGYRIKSNIATRFRQWATQRLSLTENYGLILYTKHEPVRQPLRLQDGNGLNTKEKK